MAEGEVSASSPEEVKTLFISGLPNDIKEREIYNLFRSHHGYESSQLRHTGRGHQIVAFAVFSSQVAALAAKDALNGHKLDPELDSTLHIELARANSRLKRPLSDEIGEGAMDKKFRGHVQILSTYTEAGRVHPVYNNLHGHPPSQSALMGGYAMLDGFTGSMMASAMPPPPIRGSNTPCSTLFISNLGYTCTEAELTEAISSIPGLRKVKMQSRGGIPIAFVEFQDVRCSTQAMNQLQNAMLPSSVHGGILVEYARSRMGQPGRHRLQQALA